MLPAEFAELNRMLGRQEYRALLARTRSNLAADPLNPHLHAARTVGCRHYGDLPCVDQSYEESLPSPSLDFLRELARADALHHQGHPRQAADLRRAMVVDHAKPLREERLLGKIVLDLEQAGDLEGAWDAAWEAVALDPDSPNAWALVARIEAASGSIESAESYLWTADRVRSSTLSMTVATADIHRKYGDPFVASTLFLQPNPRRQKQLSYAIARNQSLLAAGLYGEVLDIFHVRIWFLGDELWHPDLLRTVGQALALDGQSEQALAYAMRLEDTYPDNPRVQASVRTIRQTVTAGTAPAQGQRSTP